MGDECHGCKGGGGGAPQPCARKGTGLPSLHLLSVSSVFVFLGLSLLSYCLHDVGRSGPARRV